MKLLKAPASTTRPRPAPRACWHAASSVPGGDGLNPDAVNADRTQFQKPIDQATIRIQTNRSFSLPTKCLRNVTETAGCSGMRLENTPVA